MAMNYKEVPKSFPEEAAKYSTGVELVDDFVNSLQRRGLLPERFLEPSKGQPEAGKPAVTEQTQNHLLQQAIEEYKEGPPTPESVTNYWWAKLRADGARAGLNIAVPDCDWTEEEIQKPMVDIKGNPVPGMMVYKPEQFRGEEGLILLARLYPKIAVYSTREDTPITNTHETHGWIKVEAVIDAPNLNTRLKELEDFAKEQGYIRQAEGTYVLASQASKDLYGQFFDEGNTSSRLLGFRGEDVVIIPDFLSEGYWAVVQPLYPQDCSPRLGARFEEVKRT